MKYLSNYVEEGQTKAIKKAGGFFAFSDKQMDKQKQTGVKYVSIGAGLICDKTKAKQLCEDLENIQQAGIKQDIRENGKDGVIQRELENHEICITGDITDTARALQDYPITTKEIMEGFILLNNKYQNV